MSLTMINSDNIFMKGVIGNVRKAQEDSHDMAIMTPNGDIFVVCDGMGGHVGGAKASSIAVNSIIEYLKKEKYDNIPQALNDAIQFANTQIIGFASANPEFKGMGTTACILLLQGNDAFIAHVGDSRIYLYLGKEQQLHRVTKDHSYVQTLVDKGEISDDDAEHHPNKNRILKALGIRPDMSPTIACVHPKNGDVFMICTDGLNGMICDNTIEQVLRQDMSLEAKGELLINLAMQGENGYPGGQDNCTLELIKIDNSPWERSEFTSYSPKRQYTASRQTAKPANNSNVNVTKTPAPTQIPLKKILLIAIPLIVILLMMLVGKSSSEKNYVEKKKDLKIAIDSCTKKVEHAIGIIMSSGYDDNIIKTQQNEVANYISRYEIFKIPPSSTLEDVIECIEYLSDVMKELSDEKEKTLSKEEKEKFLTDKMGEFSLLNDLSLLGTKCSALKDIERYRGRHFKTPMDYISEYSLGSKLKGVDGGMEGCKKIENKIIVN